MFAPKIERMDTASVNKRLSQRLSLAATGGSGDGDGKGDEPGAKRGKRGRKVKRGAGEGEAEEEEGLLKADIYTVADFCYMAQMGYERAFMYFWKLAVRAKAEEIAVREGIIERKNSMLERQGSVAEVVADDEDGDSEDDEEESTGVFAHGVVARPEELVLDPSNPHHVWEVAKTACDYGQGRADAIVDFLLSLTQATRSSRRHVLNDHFVNRQDRSGYTLLMYAAGGEKDGVAKNITTSLLNRNAYYFQKVYGSGEDVLKIAADSANIEVFTKIIQKIENESVVVFRPEEWLELVSDAYLEFPTMTANEASMLCIYLTESARASKGLSFPFVVKEAVMSGYVLEQDFTLIVNEYAAHGLRLDNVSDLKGKKEYILPDADKTYVNYRRLIEESAYLSSLEYKNEMLDAFHARDMDLTGDAVKWDFYCIGLTLFRLIPLDDLHFTFEDMYMVLEDAFPLCFLEIGNRLVRYRDLIGHLLGDIPVAAPKKLRRAMLHFQYAEKQLQEYGESVMSYVSAIDTGLHTVETHAKFTKLLVSYDYSIEYWGRVTEIAQLFLQDRSKNPSVFDVNANSPSMFGRMYSFIITFQSRIFQRSSLEFALDVSYQAENRLSVEYLSRLININPGFVSVLLQTERLNMLRIDTDDDVEYHFNFPIAKGKQVMSGGEGMYDESTRLWARKYNKIYDVVCPSDGKLKLIVANESTIELGSVYATLDGQDLRLTADCFRTSYGSITYVEWLYSFLWEQKYTSGKLSFVPVVEQSRAGMEVHGETVIAVFTPVYVEDENRRFRSSVFEKREFSAVAYQSPLPQLASKRAIEFYAELADASDDKSFFKSKTVQLAVEYAWQQYGRTYHFSSMALYIAYLILISISNYEFPVLLNPDSRFSSGQGVVLGAILINTYFAALEAREAVLDVDAYFSVAANYSDISGLALVYAGSFLRIIHNRETKESASIMSVAVLIIWFNLIYYLRPFKSGSAVVRMFYVDVSWELRFFLFILLFILFAFSQALFVIGHTVDGGSFVTPANSFLNSFYYMISGTDFKDFDGNENQSLGLVLLTLLTFTCAILILNLLVGVLGSSYDKIQENVSFNIFLEKCRVMNDQYWFTDPVVPNYLYVLCRLDDEEDEAPPDKNSESLALSLNVINERVVDMKHGFENVNLIPSLDPLKKGKNVNLTALNLCAKFKVNNQYANTSEGKVSSMVFGTICYDLGMGAGISGNYFEIRFDVSCSNFDFGLAEKEDEDRLKMYSYELRANEVIPAGAGDVFGCGIDFTNRRVFFTLNGERIPDRSEEKLSSEKIFPFLSAAEGQVWINFGEAPFVYKEGGVIAHPKTSSLLEKRIQSEEMTLLKSSIAELKSDVAEVKSLLNQILRR